MWRILEVSADEKAAPSTTCSFLDKDSEQHNYIFNYDQLDRSVERIHSHQSECHSTIIPTVSAQVQWTETPIECRKILVHSLSTNDLNTDPLPFIDQVESLPVYGDSTENLPQKVFTKNNGFRLRARSRSLTPITSRSLLDLSHCQQSTRHYSSATIDHRSSFS